MAVGGGALPTGPLLTAWSAITRRSFIPECQVLPYPTTPTLALMMAARSHGTGGVSSITQTVQYAQASQGGFIGLGGDFATPEALVPVMNAEWNYKWYALPVIILVSEIAAQQDQAVVNILEMRMVDATNLLMNTLSNYLWYNVPDAPSAPSSTTWPGLFQDTLGITGFAELIDDGTLTPTYGGLPRSNASLTPNWQSIVYNLSGVTPTRAECYNRIIGVAQTFGEKPTFGTMPFGVWANIAADFIGTERTFLNPNQPESEHYESAFDAIRLAGVNLIADPMAPVYTVGAQATGNMLLINTNYMYVIAHSAMDWAFKDFVDLQSAGKLAYLGVLLFMAEVVNTRPAMHAKVTGYNSISI